MQAVTSSSNTPIVIGSIPAASSPFAEGVLRLVGTGSGGVNGGTITVNGDVAGKLELNGNIVMNVTINGELSGRFTSTGSLTSGDTITITDGISSTGLLSLGGSLTGNLSLPANGLEGQVIFNAGNTGGSWTGTITIGSTTISHTGGVYTNLPSALGGGSIGLAPFKLHETACTPPHGQEDTPGPILENSSFETTGDMPVLIRLFGPIVKADPEDSWTDCVHIQCRPIGAGDECSWVNVTTGFRVRGPGDTDWTGDERSLGLSRAAGMYPKVGVYRVALKSGRVVCAEVTGAPAVVWPLNCAEGNEPRFAYTFRIEPDCDNDQIGDFVDESVDCDFNPCHVNMDEDNSVTVADIFAFLTYWFSGHPRADFDKSGVIDVSDIFAYLTAWFVTNSLECPA
ncbi:MAG: hypothetical protein KF869_02090 [Phycisphaeraceae bacterium]|nr:hypothetical protein [Phycisphaeraceae bacterium]